MPKYIMLSVLWLGSTGGAVAIRVWDHQPAYHYQVWLTVVSVVITFLAIVAICADIDEGR